MKEQCFIQHFISGGISKNYWVSLFCLSVPPFLSPPLPPFPQTLPFPTLPLFPVLFLPLHPSLSPFASPSHSHCATLSRPLEVDTWNAARGLGERYKLPQRGLGRSPAEIEFLHFKLTIWHLVGWQQIYSLSWETNHQILCRISANVMQELKHVNSAQLHILFTLNSMFALIMQNIELSQWWPALELR